MEKRLKGSKADEIFLSQKNAYSDLMNKDHIYNNDYLNIDVYTKWRNLTIDRDEKRIWDGRMIHMALNMDSNSMDKSIRNLIRKGVPDALKHLIWVRSNYVNYFVISFPKFYETTLYNTFGDKIPDDFSNDCPTFCGGILGLQEDIMCVQTKIEEIEIDNNMEGDNFNINDSTSNILQLLFNTPNEVKKDSDKYLLPEHNFWIEPKTLSSPNFYFASSAINTKKKKKFFHIENVKNKILKSKKLDNYLRVSSDSILPCSNNFDGRNGRKLTEESEVRKKNKAKKKENMEGTEDKVRVIRNHMDTMYSMEVDEKNDQKDTICSNSRRKNKENIETLNRNEHENENENENDIMSIEINKTGKQENKTIGDFKVVDGHTNEKNIYIKDDIISFHEISNKPGKGGKEKNDQKSFHVEKDIKNSGRTNSDYVDITQNTQGNLDTNKYLHIQYYMNEQYRISKKQAEKMSKAKLYLRNKRRKKMIKHNEKGGSLNLDNDKVNENEEEEDDDNDDEGHKYAPSEKCDSINSDEKSGNDENESFGEKKRVSFYKTRSFFKKKFQSRQSFLKKNERNLSDHITLLLNETSAFDSDDTDNLKHSASRKKKGNSYFPETRRVASMIEMNTNERQMQKKEEYKQKDKKNTGIHQIKKANMDSDIKTFEKKKETTAKDREKITLSTFNSNELQDTKQSSINLTTGETYSLKNAKCETSDENEENSNKKSNKKKNRINIESENSTLKKSLLKKLKNIFYKKNKKNTTEEDIEENDKKKKKKEKKKKNEAYGMPIKYEKNNPENEQTEKINEGKQTTEILDKSYRRLDVSHAIRNEDVNFSSNEHIKNKSIETGMIEKNALENEIEENIYNDIFWKPNSNEKEINENESTTKEQVKYNIVIHNYQNKQQKNQYILPEENDKREEENTSTQKEMNKNQSPNFHKMKNKKLNWAKSCDPSVRKLEENTKEYDANYKVKAHTEMLDSHLSDNSDNNKNNANGSLYCKNNFQMKSEILCAKNEEGNEENKNIEKEKNNFLNIDQYYMDKANSQEETSYQFDYRNSFDNDLENFHLPSRELKSEETMTKRKQQKNNFNEERTEKRECKSFKEEEEEEEDDYENGKYIETKAKNEFEEEEEELMKENEKRKEMVSAMELTTSKREPMGEPNTFDNIKNAKQFENELYHKFYENYEKNKSYPNVYNLDDATELTALLNDDGKREIKKLLWAINSNFGNDVEFAPIIPNLCIILLIYFNASVVYCIVHCLIQKGIESIKNKETPFFVFKRKDFVKYIKYILNSFIRFLPKCYYYLRKLNFDLAAWTARCIQDGFSRMLPFDFVLRIYGAFLFEGQKILCLYCLALLKFLENDILKCTNIEEVENILYHICMNPYLDINELTQMAYKFKLKHKVKPLKFSTKCPSPYLMNVKIKTFYRPRLKDTSVIISSVHWENLWEKIPSNVRTLDPTLTYCSQTDGYSLKHLLVKSERYKRKPMILIVETSNADLIGFFCPYSLNSDISFFKDADKSTAFVCSFISTFRCYKWSGKNSMLILIRDGIYIGGNDVAIYLDKDIKYGRTNKSESFMSPPLISEGVDFQIKNVEIWHLE